MNNFNARLGRIIRDLRKRNAVTLEQLAEEAEVDVSFLSRLERGHHGLGLENAVKIAKALGTTVSVLSGEPEPRAVDPRARRLADRTARVGPAAFKAVEAVVSAMESQEFGERRRTPRR